MVHSIDQGRRCFLQGCLTEQVFFRLRNCETKHKSMSTVFSILFSVFNLDNSWMLVYVSIAIVAIGLLTAWAARIPLVYNLRNLKVRYRTTILTGLAFTMVAAVLTGMLGFVNGLKEITDSSGRPKTFWFSRKVRRMKDSATWVLVTSMKSSNRRGLLNSTDNRCRVAKRS